MKKIIHIKEHTHRLKNGKVIKVKAHDIIRYIGTTRKSSKDIKGDKRKRGKELERLLKRKRYIKDKDELDEKDTTSQKAEVSKPKEKVKMKADNKPKAYKPTADDLKRGFHLFNDGSIKYYKKKEAKHKKDGGVKWTSAERSKGYKLVTGKDGRDTIYYTDAMLKKMAETDA